MPTQLAGCSSWACRTAASNTPRQLRQPPWPHLQLRTRSPKGPPVWPASLGPPRCSLGPRPQLLCPTLPKPTPRCCPRSASPSPLTQSSSAPASPLPPPPMPLARIVPARPVTLVGTAHLSCSRSPPARLLPGGMGSPWRHLRAPPPQPPQVPTTRTQWQLLLTLVASSRSDRTLCALVVVVSPPARIRGCMNCSDVRLHAHSLSGGTCEQISNACLCSGANSGSVRSVVFAKPACSRPAHSVPCRHAIRLQRCAAFVQMKSWRGTVAFGSHGVTKGTATAITIT